MSKPRSALAKTIRSDHNLKFFKGGLSDAECWAFRARKNIKHILRILQATLHILLLPVLLSFYFLQETYEKFSTGARGFLPPKIKHVSFPAKVKYRVVLMALFFILCVFFFALAKAIHIFLSPFILCYVVFFPSLVTVSAALGYC